MLLAEMRQSSRRRCVFREEDSVPRCSVLHNVWSRAAAEIEDDMISESTCAAGGLRARSIDGRGGVHEGSLAISHNRTTETGGRQLFEGAPSVSPSSAVAADILCLSTSQHPPAVIMQQQLQPTQQRWLPSRSQQLCEQRQLQCEPISYSPQVLHPQREIRSREQPPQSTWLQYEQPQSQQRLQNEVQDEYSHFKQPSVQQCYQVNFPHGNARVCYSSTGIAPSFASINRAICTFSQKAAPEPTDAAATCPFDRLRVLGTSLRSDMASASRFAATDDGAHASDVAQSSAAAEFLHGQAIRGVRGQRDDALAKLSLDMPLRPPREEVSTASCPPEPLFAVSPLIADVAGNTIACPVAGTLDPARAVEDSDALTACVANYARISSSSSLSASVAPPARRDRATENLFQLSASECASGSQAQVRRTGVVPARQTNTYRRILRGAVSSNDLDAAYASILSSAVAASIEPEETAGASLHTSTASAAGAPRCCSSCGSARRLSSSETATETLAGSAGVANRLFAGGFASERGSSVANAPDISTDMYVATDRGGLRMPACNVREFDDGTKKRSNESVLNDEVQRRLIRQVDHADYEKPENLLEDRRNQGTQRSEEEQQQAGQEHEKQQRQATLFVEKRPHHGKQRIQAHEEIVSVQQLNTQEDVRILAQMRRRASTTFDGRIRSTLMPARRCSGLQNSHAVLVDTAAAQENDASGSKRCSQEEIQKQKAQASESAAERCFNSVGECAPSASSGGDPAEAGVREPLGCASELADLSMTWQPVMPPVTRTSSCSATVAPPTAARETIDSDFRWTDPPAAPRRAIDSAAAAHGASAAGRSVIIPPPIHRYLPQVTCAVCASDSSLPSFSRQAVIPQKHQNSQQQCIAPSLGTPASGVPVFASTGRQIFSSYGFTSTLRQLSSGGLEKLESVSAETTGVSTASSATPAAHVLRQSSTSENPRTGNTAELHSPMRLVLPRDSDYSFLSQGSSGTPIHGGSEIANQFQGPPAIAASFSTKMVGEVAVTARHHTGFPSYPTYFAESGFRQDPLPAEALHQTHATVGALTWTEPIFSNRRAEPQEIRFRAARWVSHPVFRAQQQASQSFRSARRRCVCGLTEERERRQLRVVSCIIGAILIAGIFCRAIGIVFFRTTSHAVNGEQYYFAHSQKEPARNMPITDRTHSVDAPSAKSWISHFFSVLARISRRAPHSVAEAAIKLPDVSACAQLVATPAGLSNGSTTFSSRVAQFATTVLVRLSARRRRSPDAWMNRAGGLCGSSSAIVSSEMQQQHRQRNRGGENYRGGDVFARTRWRRRKSYGSSPIGTLLLYIAFFFRSVIPMMIAALHILVGAPLFYILRSLMLLMLRISASFVCTAFVFVFAGRLVLDRLKAFRLACVPSSGLGQSSRSSHTDSDIMMLGDSSLEQCPSNVAPASPPRTITEGGNSELEGPGIFDASDSSRSPAEPTPCTRSCRRERPHEVGGIAATAFSHGLSPSAAADENFVSFVDIWVALAALRAHGLTKLGYLSGVVLKRSLHASKTVVTHIFPLVSVAASAAVSFVTSVENFSTQPSSASEQRIQHEAALSPEHPARVARRRESETPSVEE